MLQEILSLLNICVIVIFFIIVIIVLFGAFCYRPLGAVLLYSIAQVAVDFLVVMSAVVLLNE